MWRTIGAHLHDVVEGGDADPHRPAPPCGRRQSVPTSLIPSDLSYGDASGRASDRCRPGAKLKDWETGARTYPDPGIALVALDDIEYLQISWTKKIPFCFLVCAAFFI
jgi:hypothetical protein